MSSSPVVTSTHTHTKRAFEVFEMNEVPESQTSKASGNLNSSIDTEPSKKENHSAGETILLKLFSPTLSIARMSINSRQESEFDRGSRRWAECPGVQRTNLFYSMISPSPLPAPPTWRQWDPPSKPLLGR